METITRIIINAEYIMKIKMHWDKTVHKWPLTDINSHYDIIVSNLMSLQPSKVICIKAVKWCRYVKSVSKMQIVIIKKSYQPWQSDI